MITECANCYAIEECLDDGEACICVDRAACQQRTRRRGKFVTVRTFGGRVSSKLRIWTETADAVFVHNEAEYQKRVNGIAHLLAVGFPIAAIDVSDE